MRKGEHGSLVVYADKIIRTETDSATGEESEYAIPFLKGCTVFNVEQVDGLPEHYYAKPAPRVDAIEPIERALAAELLTASSVETPTNLEDSQKLAPGSRQRFDRSCSTTARSNCYRRSGL